MSQSASTAGVLPLCVAGTYALLALLARALLALSSASRAPESMRPKAKSNFNAQCPGSFCQLSVAEQRGSSVSGRTTAEGCHLNLMQGNSSECTQYAQYIGDDRSNLSGGVQGRYSLWAASIIFSLSLSYPFLRHAAEKKSEDQKEKHWVRFLFLRGKLDIYVEAIALETARRKKGKVRGGRSLIKKLIEQYAIYLLPLEFCGWCLRSVLPMWAGSFGHSVYSDDGRLILMLDIFDYKLAVVGLCWLTQITALGNHFGTIKMQRFNTEVLLPFMYNIAFMPVVEACTHMLVCSDNSDGHAALKLSPEMICWEGKHAAIAFLAFSGGLLFLLGGLLYKNTRVSNFLWAGGQAFYRYDEGFALTLSLAFYLMPCTSVLLQDSPWTSGAVFLVLFSFLLVQTYQLQPCQGVGTTINGVLVVGFSGGVFASIFVLLTALLKELHICDTRTVNGLVLAFFLGFAAQCRLAWRFNATRAGLYTIPDLEYLALISSKIAFQRQVGTLALSRTRFYVVLEAIPQICNRLHQLLEPLLKKPPPKHTSLTHRQTEGGRFANLQASTSSSEGVDKIFLGSRPLEQKLEAVYASSALLNLDQARDINETQLIHDKAIKRSQKTSFFATAANKSEESVGSSTAPFELWDWSYSRIGNNLLQKILFSDLKSMDRARKSSEAHLAGNKAQPVKHLKRYDIRMSPTFKMAQVNKRIRDVPLPLLNCVLLPISRKIRE
jgi:hypothetical protein